MVSGAGTLRLHDLHAVLSTVQLPAALVTPDCLCHLLLAVLPVKSVKGHTAFEFEEYIAHWPHRRPSPVLCMLPPMRARLPPDSALMCQAGQHRA